VHLNSALSVVPRKYSPDGASMQTEFAVI